MSTFFEILIAVVVIWFVWRFVSALFQPQQPDDPFASVPVPRKDSPKGRSSAVALEEPEDDDSADGFSTADTLGEMLGPCGIYCCQQRTEGVLKKLSIVRELYE